MMKSTHAAVLALFGLLLVSYAAQGLKCVVCSGGADCISSYPNPQDCPKEMKYCLKVSTYDKDNNLNAVVRSCNPIAEENNHKCIEIPLIGGKACSDTCNTDGCNTASLQNPQLFLVVLAAAAVAIFNLRALRD